MDAVGCCGLWVVGCGGGSDGRMVVAGCAGKGGSALSCSTASVLHARWAASMGLHEPYAEYGMGTMRMRCAQPWTLRCCMGKLGGARLDGGCTCGLVGGRTMRCTGEAARPLRWGGGLL